MPAKINLIGQTFGQLKVIQETEERKNNSVVWLCQCNCGNIIKLSTKELRSDGIIQCKNCGSQRDHIKKITENYIGIKFNKLTVVEKTDQKQKDGKILYKCICDCGQEVLANITDLKRGHKKSCGCLKRKYQIGDIINNRKIISIIGTKDNLKKGNFYYECKCLLCGNIYESLAQTLDNTISCGCQKSKGEFNIVQILNKNNILYQKEYCISKGEHNYRFDFAIMNSNNQPIRLIEFDGEQHYEENIKNSGWNTYEKYEYTFNNDMIKNSLAREYGIPLVRIPYWERDSITLELLFEDKYLIL